MADFDFKEDTFEGSIDHSQNLANQGNQIIEFYHVPSKNSVRFKSFLTAFDDAFSSEWNSESVFGRMDPMQSFQRTGRKISIGFDVVAGSSLEALNNMDRISFLLQMLYPSYDAGNSGATSIKAAPYFKLNFMNLSSQIGSLGEVGAKKSGLLGTLEGFTYSPNLEIGFFQVGTQLLPKVISLSCTLTVLHQSPLGWEQGKTSMEQRGFFSAFPYGRDQWQEPPGGSQSELPQTETQIKEQANDPLIEAKSQAVLNTTTDAGSQGGFATGGKVGGSKMNEQELRDLMHGGIKKHGSSLGGIASAQTAKNAMGQPVTSPTPPNPPVKKEMSGMTSTEKAAYHQAQKNALRKEGIEPRSDMKGTLYGNATVRQPTPAGKAKRAKWGKSKKKSAPWRK